MASHGSQRVGKRFAPHHGAKGTCRRSAGLERAAREHRLFVSDISFWEVSLKVSKGQLALPMNATLRLGQATGAPGIQGLALTRDVLIQSTQLAGDPHPDPADRMLIAHAQVNNMSLVTCDARIIAYAARQRGVPVCDARR